MVESDSDLNESKLNLFISLSETNMQKMNHMETETLTFISLYFVAVSLGLTIALSNGLPNVISRQSVVLTLLLIGIIPYLSVYRWNKYYQIYKEKWLNCTRKCCEILGMDDPSVIGCYCSNYEHCTTKKISSIFKLHFLLLISISVIELILLIVFTVG